MKKFSTYVVLIIGFIASCKKAEINPVDVIQPNSPTGSGNFFSQLAAEAGVPDQVFQIDASQWEQVIGTGGTKIWISPNSFVDANNQAVSGQVEIRLKEVFSKKDMVLSSAPTSSNGAILLSGGEIKLEAFQNNQELFLAGPNMVTVMIPAGTNPSIQMEEFYASTLDANNDWQQLDTSSTISVTQDTSTFTNYYTFQIDSMNWVNCDYFGSYQGPFTQVSMTVGNTHELSNTACYMSLNGQNALLSFWYYQNHVFSTSNIPVGLQVSFIAISKIGNQYYCDIHQGTLSANHNETMNLQPMTLAQIQAALNNLP